MNLGIRCWSRARLGRRYSTKEWRKMGQGCNPKMRRKHVILPRRFFQLICPCCPGQSSGKGPGLLWPAAGSSRKVQLASITRRYSGDAPMLIPVIGHIGIALELLWSVVAAEL